MVTLNLIPNFFEFIYDRQVIWHKRNVLNLSSPWSDDAIFQTYKFCNVYPNAPYLILHNIQNSLCEFRKYWRLKADEKAKKRYFKS